MLRLSISWLRLCNISSAKQREDFRQSRLGCTNQGNIRFNHISPTVVVLEDQRCGLFLTGQQALTILMDGVDEVFHALGCCQFWVTTTLPKISLLCP